MHILVIEKDYVLAKVKFKKADSCVNTAHDRPCVVHYTIFCLYSTLMTLTWIFQSDLNFQTKSNLIEPISLIKLQ